MTNLSPPQPEPDDELVDRLLGTDDTLTASKQLKAWVEQGVLSVANPKGGRSLRRYTRPDIDRDPESFSKPVGKRPTEMQ